MIRENKSEPFSLMRNKTRILSFWNEIGNVVENDHNVVRLYHHVNRIVHNYAKHTFQCCVNSMQIEFKLMEAHLAVGFSNGRKKSRSGENSVPGRQLYFPRDTTTALWTRRSLPIGRRDSDLRYLHTHM